MTSQHPRPTPVCAPQSSLTKLRARPARQKSLEFLSALIDQHRADNQPRLPTVSRMAAMAGVAKPTMQQAVNKLKEAGTLVAAQGRWVELADKSTLTPHIQLMPGASATSPRERLSVRIMADIVNTTISSTQSLPSLKELGGRYGVTHRTLCGALDLLEKRGQLQRQGKRWTVARHYSPHGATIVVIARGEESGDLVLYQPWGFQSLHTLEEECARQGSLTLEPTPIYFIGPRMRWSSRLNKMLSPTQGSRDVLGFILWSTAIQRQTLERLTTLINRSGRPAAILDEDPSSQSNLALPALCRHTPSTAIFSIGNGTRPGEDVGRYLIGRGHRRIVFVSHVSAHSWAHRRLRGLVQSFAQCGFANAVTAVEVDDTKQPETSAPGKGELHTIMEALNPIVPLDMQLLYNGRYFEDATMRGPLRQVLTLASLARRRTTLAPVFEQILATTNASVWVAENDLLALSMLDFLTTRGVRVPDTISVVGFDNSSESFIQNLTSYDFNAPAAFRAMVAHLLNPSAILGAHAPGTRIAIDGFLRARRTCGAAQA